MNSSILLNKRKRKLARKIVHKSRVRLPPRDPRSCDESVNTSSFYVQSLVQNCCNFRISDAPARLMYRDNDSWVDFEGSVVEVVRDCFVMKNSMVEVKIGGVLCLFDFYRMLVFDFETQFEKSVAWIDVKGKCFFPKFVVGGDDEFSSFRGYSEGSRKLEIEIRVSGGKVSNKRKRECEEVKSVGSFSNVNGIKKEKREVVCQEMESMRWMKAILIGEGGKMYSIVKNFFLNWAGIKSEITGIHQISRTTPVDRARYEGFLNQVQITKAARGQANVTFAWIKCSSEGVNRILNHGFSNPMKASLGESFGVGIYLSPVKSTRASVMPHDTGENHVILCRVILGKCEKVPAGSQQLYPSSAEFDTGVDDLSNPKWYIVWGANMNTHILPECVVSYKHTRNVPGQLLGTQLGQSSATLNLMWMPKVSNAMTAKFFSKLIRSLPSSKVPELRTLCCTYKSAQLRFGIFLPMFVNISLHNSGLEFFYQGPGLHDNI